MKAKINFKKIISYLLVFTVLVATVQIGNIKPASADTVTSSGVSQIQGITLYKSDSIEDSNKITIDKTSSGKYIARLLPVGQTFNLVPSSGYTITNVVSSNPNSMSVQSQSNGSNYNWNISSITDASDFYLTITVQDSTGVAQTYTLNMEFEVDSILKFGRMNVTLDGETDPHVLNYGTDISGKYTLPNVASSVKNAKIELVESDGTPMTCTINGSSNNTVDLTGGDNVISIKVTKLGVSKVYTLVITKKGEAKLQSLVPSIGTLDPAFNSDIFDYQLTVPTDQTTISFTPTSVDNSTTIKVNNSVVTSGKKSQNIKLKEGENTVTVEVTTANGDTNVYTIVVTRTEMFRSASLTSLNLTAGTLTPTFNKGIYEYNATVENDVTSIGVTPTAEDTNATITVNGKNVPSGATSNYVSLDEGSNVINVKVTDTKNNSNTYVLNVTRRYSKDNVNLSSLSVTDGTMSPTFDPETYLYSVKVARSVEKVRVAFTAQNDKATIKVIDPNDENSQNKEYTSGQSSDYVKLNIGANLITVEVTGEDTTKTTTYKLSIIRGDIEGTNQWVLVGDNWTFYNGAGIQQKNTWVKYDNQWYHLDINGYLDKNGWINVDGNYYYLNANGIMITGWFYEKGYWYYLQGDGSMRSNCWAMYDGNWYFFNDLGEMQTGWTLYGGRWYYMDDHGIMQKGWITYDKNKYYLNDDGTMKNGWLYNGRVWYYFDNSGKMQTGWQTIEGKNYYFDNNGAMKTGMMFLDGKWINLNNI